MKNILKVLAFGAMLAASSTLAYASPMTGTITINGATGSISPTTLSGATTSISFASGTELTDGYTGTLGSGLVSLLPNGFPVTETVSFVSTFTIPNTTGVPFSGATLFTYISNSSTVTFTVTQVIVGTNGSLIFYGTLTGGTAASYVLTPVAPGGIFAAPDGSFTGTLSVPPVSPTPEPSSLILLGTGLAGAAGLMMRRRRTASKA
jgi:hypothetical protein